MKQTITVFLRNYKALIILLALGFIMRGVFFGAILRNHGPQGFALPVNEDSGEYVAIAKNLADRGIFSRDPAPPFSPERLRTPGYPLFLAVWYRLVPSLPFLAAMQNIFFLIGIILAYHISLRAFGDKTAALIAAGVLAIEPTVAYWNNQLTTESIFTVSLLAATYCFLAFLHGSPRRFIFYAGFFLGFALLIRPITEYLGIIFLAALFVLGVRKRMPWKRLIFGAAILAAGYFITVAPWMIRNQLLFGTTSVSTMNVGFGKYLKAMHRELGISVNYAFYGGIPRTEVERLALVRADALRLVAQHPFLFAKIHAIGLAPFFLGDGYGTTFGVLFPALRETRVVTDWSGSPAEIVSFLRGHTGLEGVVFWGGKLVWGTLVLMALVGAGLLLRAGGWNRRFAIFFLLIIYYFALASGVGSYSRFRFPVNTFIFLFAAIGSAAAIRRYKEVKRLDRERSRGVA